MDIWLQGFIIGLSIAAPVGPIGVLCIRRTLAGGRLYGLVTGMGAAVTDLIYASIGGFGLTIISNFLVSQQNLFRLIGGIFIIYLGYKIFITKPAVNAPSPTGYGLLTAFASSFVVAITNPIAIIYYIAVFAGLGVTMVDNSYFTAAILVAGVFIGSTLWWLILSQGVALVKNQITQGRLKIINGLSGIVIACFGVYAIWSSIF